GHLRMNDLHTASLTAEPAALLGGAALINEAHDRNDVDLSRVSEANQRAPWFLEHLADLVDVAVRRHGRATLLALHGWTLAPLVDAVQLELGIALRWPGPWRARLVAACTEALPALLAAPHPASAPPGDTTAAALAPPVPRRLEFAGAALSGLVGLDAGRTGRLLLFPAAGGLVLFTGERLGHTPGGLRVEPSASGGLALRYDGPLLRFPDTTPFLDL